MAARTSVDESGRLPAGARERLLDYLTKWTGDADLAEDLVQETSVRWWRERPGGVRNADAWLFRVATNLARDALRAESRRNGLRACEVETLAPSPPRPADDRLEAAEIRRVVHEALVRLSERDRTALLMREQGFKHREIAEALDLQTNAVGMVLARAVKKLAAFLPPKEVLE